MDYQIGECQLTARAHELTRTVVSVDLELQIFSLLETLVANPDRVKSKEDLIDDV
jgi:DNA-binding response OmpR family regulator